jgi:hypothetical protein
MFVKYLFKQNILPSSRFQLKISGQSLGYMGKLETQLQVEMHTIFCAIYNQPTSRFSESKYLVLINLLT